jgi:gluconokinase
MRMQPPLPGGYGKDFPSGPVVDSSRGMAMVAGMAFPLRSPRDTIGGIMVFGRILDKIRLHARGALPAGYHLGVIAGKRTFDDRICRFLRVDFSALETRVLEGGTDEEILTWCFANGCHPDAEQIEIFNGFMSKRGWRDAASEGLGEQKAAAGLADRADITTFFELMDAEEGRGG